jgi:DNA repair protein RecO (recombination protein O)
VSVNRTYPITAIALRGYPLNEADRILVLFSPDEGLKRVVAKGLRKPKSRIGGRLEPFRENQILLAKGRNMDLVTQVESLRSFPAIQTDYDSLAAAMSAAELLLAFVEEGVPSEDVYEHFVEFLGLLGPNSEAEVLLAAYELQLLELVGYRPELQVCLTCESPLEDPKQVRGLNIEAGGTVCWHCEGMMPGRVYRLSPGAWQLLVKLQETPLDECGRFSGAGTILASCRQALKDYMSFRAEKELKAQGMFEWQGIVPQPVAVARPVPAPAPEAPEPELYDEAEIPF